MTHQVSQAFDPCLECGALSDYQGDGQGVELVQCHADIDYLDKSYRLGFWLCRPCAVSLAGRGANDRLNQKLFKYIYSVQPPNFLVRFFRWAFGRS